MGTPLKQQKAPTWGRNSEDRGWGENLLKIYKTLNTAVNDKSEADLLTIVGIGDHGTSSGTESAR